MPLVRAANTGISAVVDSMGRIIASLDLGEHGFLDARLPKPTPEPTPYSRYGDVIVLLAGLTAMLTVFAVKLQK